MRIGVYPGTFDPVTLGHLDIVARAVRLVDRLVVGVTTNPAKSPMFSPEERLRMMREAADEIGGAIEVVGFHGLVVEFARAHCAQLVVRGLRSGTDYDYEQQMAAMNHRMAPDVDTAFLLADPAVQPISSTLVKDIARLGGSFAPFVSPRVADAIRAKLG